jgi:hypothetical protein
MTVDTIAHNGRNLNNSGVINGWLELIRNQAYVALRSRPAASLGRRTKTHRNKFSSSSPDRTAVNCENAVNTCNRIKCQAFRNPL